MLAVKHFDPIMGIDIHIIQPPGPVPPVPIPHPYIGMVLDVMDYIPKIGATVYVNGLPRGQGGTAGQAIPPHIPMGGMFVKPPTNESELFLGSATVAVDDEPFVYGMLPVLSCQDIGMPPMPRLKKKSSTKSLVLPVSVSIPIPAGPPVMVGGPPSFLAALKSVAQKLAFAGAMKGLKKVGSKSKRLQRMVKRGSDAAHKAANKVLDKVGLGKLGRTGDRIRNAIHEKICSLTGHPVDVATGKVLTKQVDFELPGPIPLSWERVWYSTSAWRGPLGYGWHHAYDAALLPVEDKVVCIRTSDGRELDFLAIAYGEETFDRKEKVTLFRDGRGYGLRMEDGLVHRFAEVGPPGEPQRLVSIEDASGNRIRFDYDERGRLERISDSGGRELRVLSDGEGRIVAIHAPHPNDDRERIALVRYVYDGAGNLAQSQDALDGTMVYEYRGHLLVRETNKNGLSFYFQYDGPDVHAKCLRTWGDGGIYDHKLVYRFGETEVENSLGHKTTYFHKRGTVYKVVDALGVTTMTERNEFGELVREVDGLGQPTMYEYDDHGNVVKAVAPDGATTATVYDWRNRPIGSVDAVGGNWIWRYDEAGRLVERSDPLGRSIKYVWAEGRIQTFVDPAGQPTSFRYDRAGNITSKRTPDGAETSWEYDRLGRWTVRRNSKGAEHRREYDLLGRVVRVLESDGDVRELTYDREGNIVHTRDSRSNATFSYRGVGRVASRTQDGKTIFFEYDTEEQLQAIRNETGHEYRFALDASGELVEEIGFDGIRRRFVRDKAGRIVRVDRPEGRFSEYTHDAMGRILSISHFDGHKEWFVYRKDGQLIEAGNGIVTVKLERNLVGHVVKETQGTDWVASEYDVLGQRIKMTSSKGAEIAMRRNAAGDVLELKAGKADSSAFRADFLCDSLGKEIERALPGGVRSRWERDRLGRPLRHEIWAAGNWGTAREYRWDANERLNAVIQAAKGHVNYTHDGLGNLVKATYEDGRVDFRVPDAVDNLFRTVDRSDRRYGPSGQLLEATGPRGLVRYEYDSEGNLARKIEPNGRTWMFVYDGAGRLIRVVRADGATVEFAYDALGRRVSKSYRGKRTRWIWDCNLPLHEWVETIPGAPDAPQDNAETTELADEIRRRQRVAELTSAPAIGPPVVTHAAKWPSSGAPASEPTGGTSDAPITWLFQPDSFAPVGKLVGENRYGIVADHLGTPLAMFDDAGREVWSADIDVYGELRNVRGDRQACPFRWPGQYEDPETGLYYNRFRYYDPEAGQFTSQDPIRLDAGPRLYAYTADPLKNVDPLGLTDHNEDGHGVYVIVDKSTGDPVYVGSTDDFERRTKEHVADGRMDPDKHKLVPVVEDVKYGEARGAEQALMEDLETKEKGKRGTRPGNVVDSVAADRLENPANARERSFSRGYKKHKDTTAPKARAKIKAACGVS